MVFEAKKDIKHKKTCSVSSIVPAPGPSAASTDVVLNAAASTFNTAFIRGTTNYTTLKSYTYKNGAKPHVTGNKYNINGRSSAVVTSRPSKFEKYDKAEPGHSFSKRQSVESANNASRADMSDSVITTNENNNIFDDPNYETADGSFDQFDIKKVSPVSMDRLKGQPCFKANNVYNCRLFYYDRQFVGVFTDLGVDVEKFYSYHVGERTFDPVFRCNKIDMELFLDKSLVAFKTGRCLFMHSGPHHDNYDYMEIFLISEGCYYDCVGFYEFPPNRIDESTPFFQDAYPTFVKDNVRVDQLIRFFDQDNDMFCEGELLDADMEYTRLSFAYMLNKLDEEICTDRCMTFEECYREKRDFMVGYEREFFDQMETFMNLKNIEELSETDNSTGFFEEQDESNKSVNINDYNEYIDGLMASKPVFSADMYNTFVRQLRHNKNEQVRFIRRNLKNVNELLIKKDQGIILNLVRFLDLFFNRLKGVDHFSIDTLNSIFTTLTERLRNVTFLFLVDFLLATGNFTIFDVDSIIKAQKRHRTAVNSLIWQVYGQLEVFIHSPDEVYFYETNIYNDLLQKPNVDKLLLNFDYSENVMSARDSFTNYYNMLGKVFYEQVHGVNVVLLGKFFKVALAPHANHNPDHNNADCHLLIVGRLLNVSTERIQRLRFEHCKLRNIGYFYLNKFDTSHSHDRVEASDVNRHMVNKINWHDNEFVFNLKNIDIKHDFTLSDVNNISVYIDPEKIRKQKITDQLSLLKYYTFESEDECEPESPELKKILVKCKQLVFVVSQCILKKSITYIECVYIVSQYLEFHNVGNVPGLTTTCLYVCAKAFFEKQKKFCFDLNNFLLYQSQCIAQASIFTRDRCNVCYQKVNIYSIKKEPHDCLLSCFNELTCDDYKFLDKILFYFGKNKLQAVESVKKENNSSQPYKSYHYVTSAINKNATTVNSNNNIIMSVSNLSLSTTDRNESDLQIFYSQMIQTSMSPTTTTISQPAPPTATTNTTTTTNTTASTNSTNTNKVCKLDKYSRKVFIGGLPPDIKEAEIHQEFVRFGPMTVDWPHKVDNATSLPPKGYAFLLYEHVNSVEDLIKGCELHDDNYYIQLSSSGFHNKKVQVRPWEPKDAVHRYFQGDDEQNRELYNQMMQLTLEAIACNRRALIVPPGVESYAVFVGGIPRQYRASDLGDVIQNAFGGVLCSLIDMDIEYKYPKGAGAVLFGNKDAYCKAMESHFVPVPVPTGDKKIEIKPYFSEEQMCDICSGGQEQRELQQHSRLFAGNTTATTHNTTTTNSSAAKNGLSANTNANTSNGKRVSSSCPTTPVVANNETTNNNNNSSEEERASSSVLATVFCIARECLCYYCDSCVRRTHSDSSARGHSLIRKQNNDHRQQNAMQQSVVGGGGMGSGGSSYGLQQQHHHHHHHHHHHKSHHRQQNGSNYSGNRRSK